VNSSFHARLKKRRKEKDLSQEELGKFLSLDKSTISLYESGKRHPGYDTLFKIADILDCTTDYLLGRTDDPTPPAKPKEKKEPPYVKYVLAAPDLGEALIRVANAIAEYKIDNQEAMRVSDLAFEKFGIPQPIDTDEAAHLEYNIPGTGALDENDNGNDKD